MRAQMRLRVGSRSTIMCCAITVSCEGGKALTKLGVGCMLRRRPTGSAGTGARDHVVWDHEVAGGHGPDGGDPFRPQISVQPLTHDVMVEHDSQAQRRAGDFKVDQPGGQSADTRPLSAALDHVGDHGVARATMRSSMELHALRPPPACTACATGGAR